MTGLAETGLAETGLAETGLLVIHDAGGPGGQPWADAFSAWLGPVVAPDLPGHGSAAPPDGGHHDLGDAVFAVAPLLPGADELPPVVVGVGVNGHAATLLALAGRVTALVLVDGLGGPWLDVPARDAALRAVRRRILDTPALREPHRGPGPDPRATALVPMTDRSFMVDVSRRIAVPMLVIETPASPTPDPEEVVAGADDCTLVRLADPAPSSVAAAVLEWWSGRG